MERRALTDNKYLHLKLILFLFALSSIINCACERSFEYYDPGNYSRFFSSENKLIAHRGLSSLYPENTRIAFENAAVSGFEYVECDIMLTKDNEWVLIHDDRIDRTSNGHGLVRDFTYEELKQYNFGYPDKFNNSFNHNILRLEEFCEFCESNDLKPVIEIKCEASRRKLINLIKIVNSSLSDDEFVISSLDLEILEICRKISPNITLCYNTFNLDYLSNTRNIYTLYPLTLGIYVNSIFDEQNSTFNSKIGRVITNCEKNEIIPIIWTVDNELLRQDLQDTLDCLIMTNKL